jgi:hypothetical protein
MPMKKILWWLIAGTKGGVNRARIINVLEKGLIMPINWLKN